jgi:hypothetical protein
MVDISSISGGLSIAKSVYQALDFIRGITGSRLIAAYFRHDGTRVHGSDKIEIELHRDENRQTVWWYSVKSLEDYVFVRVPVVESCAHELVGQEVGESIPDARYWRWVAPVLPGRLYGGDAVNLKVDFLVFGYKPHALIKHFSSK